MVGHKKSASYRGRTRSFRFPKKDYASRGYDGFSPCRRAVCGACAIGSLQAVSLHYDCLVIFIREWPLIEYDVLARLWAIGCYRDPWPKAPRLCLAPHEPFVDQTAMRKIAVMSGFQSLQSLPPELVELVRQVAPHTLFWRAISTITTAGHLATPS